MLVQSAVDNIFRKSIDGHSLSVVLFIYIYLQHFKYGFVFSQPDKELVLIHYIFLNLALKKQFFAMTSQDKAVITEKNVIAERPIALR